MIGARGSYFCERVQNLVHALLKMTVVHRRPSLERQRPTDYQSEVLITRDGDSFVRVRFDTSFVATGVGCRRRKEEGLCQRKRMVQPAGQGKAFLRGAMSVVRMAAERERPAEKIVAARSRIVAAVGLGEQRMSI